VILPDFLSCFPRQLSVRNRCGCARPYGMIGACIGRSAWCDFASVCRRITIGHPFLTCLAPHVQFSRLTHNLKSLKSP
jgi:hypothetical protein